MAILVLVSLRNVRTGAKEEGQPEPEGAIAGGKEPGASASASEGTCTQEEGS